MTLDQFVGIYKERLPTAAEWVAVCEELEIEFGTTADGQPCMKGDANNRQERIMLAAILGREPWRTQVLEMRGMKTPADYVAYEATHPSPPTDTPVIELLWASGLIGFRYAEEGRWDVGAGWWRNQGETAWQRIPGREHIRMLNGAPEPMEVSAV